MNEAVRQLAEGPLPFHCYGIGPLGPRRIHVEVPHDDVAAVVTHFETHPVTLSGTTLIQVDVVGRAANSWLSQPTRAGDASDALDPLPLTDLIGLGVREAARRANEAGWLVRAFEPEAALTADSRQNRMNLCYSADQLVTRAFTG